MKELMLSDAAVLLNSKEFAEEIIYTPSSGAAKTINALIIRGGSSPLGETGRRLLGNQAETYIAVDEASGITCINKKDDRIKFTDTDGSLKEARINNILSKDAGLWHLNIGW